MKSKRREVVSNVVANTDDRSVMSSEIARDATSAQHIESSLPCWTVHKGTALYSFGVCSGRANDARGVCC